MKKKILIMYNGYLPGKNYGGPVVSLSNLVESCGDIFEFHIITLNHDLDSKEKYTNINEGPNKIGKATVYYLSDDEFKYNKVKKLVETVRPNCIYQNGFFNAKFFLFSNFISFKYGIPILTSIRGELNADAFNLKKTKKLLYLFVINTILSNKNTYFHSTSLEETEAIKNKLRVTNIYEISNIPSIIKNRKINKTKEENTLKIIFLSRIQTKKNLLFAIETMKNIHDKSIIFDIYGPIENEVYWEECQKLIMEIENEVIINYCGSVDHQDISSIFSKYDLFFFPTLSENYGHVIAEALQSSCILLISDRTPWNDLADHKAGFVIPLENPQDFKKTIEELYEMNNNDFQKIVNQSDQYIEKKINIKKCIQDYVDMFENIIGEE